MSEPSSHVPEDVAEAQQDASRRHDQAKQPDLDQDKVDAWDAVKSDYEVEPDGEPVPNSMDEGGTEAAAP